MADLRLSTELQNALAETVGRKIDEGDGGSIEIYAGPRPSAPNLPPPGALLGILRFATPSFGVGSSGIVAANPILEDPAARATGMAKWARIKDGGGDALFDCDVGTAGATIILNTAAVVINGPIRITSFTIAMPSG